MAYTYVVKPLRVPVGKSFPEAIGEADRHDPTRLRDHLRQCEFACGMKHRVMCILESLNAFLAPRFVTTLALATTFVLVAIALPS